MAEEWRWVRGYKGRYEVSDFGRVRSWCTTANTGEGRRATPRVLKGYHMRQGYLQVNLRDGKATKATLVHRLVAEAFLSNPENKPYVAHNDGIPHNNRADNLRWATQAENMADTITHGTRVQGEGHFAAKLSESDVLDIRSRFTRESKGTRSNARELAVEYGVSVFTIYDACNPNRQWKFLKEGSKH